MKQSSSFKHVIHFNNCLKSENVLRFLDYTIIIPLIQKSNALIKFPLWWLSLFYGSFMDKYAAMYVEIF